MELGSATSGEWSGVKSTDWDLIAVGEKEQNSGGSDNFLTRAYHSIYMQLRDTFLHSSVLSVGRYIIQLRFTVSVICHVWVGLKCAHTL